MYSIVQSGTVFGVRCLSVDVETDMSPGLPGFEMVGMLNSEVKEAKERVKVSLKNNGFTIPPLKVTVNLSPASVRKSGTQFDLAIAVSILIAIGEIKQERVCKTMFLGELALNGELKFVKGVLPVTLWAKDNNIERIIVPSSNAKEASCVEGVEVFGFDSLIEIIRFLNMGDEERRAEYSPYLFDYDKLFGPDGKSFGVDFYDVSGQEELKRASLIASAGFHNLLMVGPPGSGKSMIARRIPTILPRMTYEECLEVSKIYSVCGSIKEFESLITKRPFVAPHHTISFQAMTGGGSVPTPGAISMAHRGVLFLDEAVHFNKMTLESLRQPLEDKKVVISRTQGNFEFPSDFMFVAAINPCPCGYFPDRNKCRCSEPEIKRYLSSLSGPILDRIDICIVSSYVSYEELNGQGKRISSTEMKDFVYKALEVQKRRFKNSKTRFNSEMNSNEIMEFCKLGSGEEEFLVRAYNKMNLSARSYHKILKVSRTIADIEGSEKITKTHLAEALNYRMNKDLYF